MSVTYNSGSPEITAYVTAHGNKSQSLITFTWDSLSNEEVTTLVIYDQQNGSFYFPTMLDYTDLN